MTHTLTVLLEVAQRLGWPPLAALLTVAWLELLAAARRQARPHARFWCRPRPLHLRHVGAHARPPYRPRHTTTLPALTAARTA